MATTKSKSEEVATKKAPEAKPAPQKEVAKVLNSGDKLQKVLEVLAEASPKIGRALREAGLL